MSQLTTTQEQVITLLAQGSTVASAAQEAGIHRNTVSNWRRTYPEFQDSLAAAQFEVALHWHEQLLAFGDRAIQTLDRIFSDENESSGVQLRAAMTVLEKLMKPGPAQPELAARRRQHQQPPVETNPSTTEAPNPTPSPSEREGRSLQTPPPRPNRTKLHNTPPEPGRNAPFLAVADSNTNAVVSVSSQSKPAPPPDQTRVAPAHARLKSDVAGVHPEPAGCPQCARIGARFGDPR